MSVRLKVVEGKPHGAVIALHGKWFYIGRDPACQLRPKNEAVADRHCALFLDGDHVEVKDLGSQGGTILNGRKLRPSISTPLHNGDRLQVGPLTFEVEVSRVSDGEVGKGRDTPMGGLDDDDESSLTAKIANRLIQRELGTGADPTKAVGAHLQAVITEGIPCVTIDMARVAEQMVPVLKKELANLAERPALTRLILDMRKVNEIDRPGIDLLLAFDKKLKEHGARLKLCEINPDVMDKLVDANLIDLLPIHLDCHDAIWSAW
ncbi:MAG: FHA domain-containing protein [Isosphaeraceae bacterium]